MRAGIPGTGTLASRFGRKRGWYHHAVAQLCWKLGQFRDFEMVDWSQVTRLVPVCSGNLCRSPYAEARAHVRGLRAISLGLNALHGSRADAVAVRIARGRGVDISRHRSRAAREFSPAPGDLVMAMEPGQARQLRAWTSGVAGQVTLLGLWAATPRAHIEDPYGLSEEYFDRCFALIDSAIDGIAARLATAGAVQPR